MMVVRRFALFAALSGLVSLTNPTALLAHSVDPLEAAPTAPAPNARTEAASGTVRELIIEDHVVGMTMRHLSLEPLSGAAVALVGTQVSPLVAGQSVFVTGRRNGNVLFVDSVRAGKATTRIVQPATEQVEGRLVMAHVDNFETGRSEFIYEVRGDDGTVTGLKLGVAPATLQAGMRVRAHGNRNTPVDDLQPSRVEILALPAATSSASTGTTTSAAGAKATTMHSVLVVAVKFTDTAADPTPIASLQSLLSSASNSVANFYKEGSYGQHQLNVTVPAAWLRANIATPTTCNYGAISNAGDAAATAAGYNPASYEYKVYMFPRVASCGWSGLGYVGFPRLAYINGPTSFVTNVVAHEMGHNFGLLHAASLDCGARVVGGTCTASEYGDPFNTMGNQTSMHFASAQKSLLGWLPATSVKTHASGSATYVLSPIESAGGAVYAIKIPAAPKRTYWIEYRQPLGFDAGLSSYPTNGAQIRVSSPFETLCPGCSGADDTELLDLTTGTTPFTDAALTVGKSYTDPDYGITINVISATAAALTVQVSGPGASSSPTATTTTLGTSANPSNWGVNVTFTATVNGNAPTGTMSFSDGATAIAGCTAVALAGSGNARTAACATLALNVGTHSITAKYSGDATNLTSTSTAVAQTIQSTTTTTSSNVALASAGGVATASSTYGPGYAVAGIINNERAGRGWGSGSGGWNDATYGKWPDWVQVNFSGTKTIDHVVVYTVQDNYGNPVEPSDSMTFTKYGLRDFSVQVWNGAAWVTVGSVTGNNLVKRTVSFTAVATDRIRINTTAGLQGYSRITEVEAWGH